MSRGYLDLPRALFLTRRIAWLQRRLAQRRRRDPPARSFDVFPRLSAAIAAGLAIGTVLALATNSGPFPLARLLLGSALGLIGGALCGLIVANGPYGHAAESSSPDGPDGLWDAWLDSDAPPEAPSHDASAPPPSRAPVRPRIIAPATGEALPLEDEILSLWKLGRRGTVCIVGSPGSGKTTALAHLAASLPPNAGIRLLDPGVEPMCDPEDARLVVYSSSRVRAASDLATYRLAPWGRDEWIEYLLATARERCAPVMRRLDTTADEIRGDNIELWRIVLDRMIADDSAQGPGQALRNELAEAIPNRPVRAVLGAYSLIALIAPERLQDEELAEVRKRTRSQPWGRWLRYRTVQVILGAELIAAELRQERLESLLALRLPKELIGAVAPLIATDRVIIDRLHGVLAQPDRTLHAMAASLLHACGTGWKPAGEPMPHLSGAYLDRACWPHAALFGIELSGAELSGADLSRAALGNANLKAATLYRASLVEAVLTGAVCCSANLRGANLARCVGGRTRFEGAQLDGANLDGAFLRATSFAGANLERASFRAADLTNARFPGAVIDDADFTGTVLTGASLKGLALRRARFADATFEQADLARCDMESMVLPDACFRGALLHSALLTCSRMPRADFRGASLLNCGLAEIDWENACLRDANLCGATFHLGSTRSGLVNSPIACEGSRTGFYTDDYDEQDYRPPEEIRKANLRGADLRGARIEDTDFYLVDLRDALYDPAQAEHFRRCGAILK